MLRHSVIFRASSTTTSSTPTTTTVLNKLRRISSSSSSSPKIITSNIFSATLECPKQGLLEFHEKNDNTNNNDNDNNSSSSSSTSTTTADYNSAKYKSLFRFDQPPRGFTPSVRITPKTLERQKNINVTSDLVPVVQRHHLVEYGRKWHRQRFQPDRVFVISNSVDQHKDELEAFGAGAVVVEEEEEEVKVVKDVFDQRCKKTQELIDKYYTSVPVNERTQSFALQGACFKTNIELPNNNNNNNLNVVVVEARVRIDLLHFIPTNQFFIGKENSTKRAMRLSPSAQTDGGCWEMIQIKPQVDPDRDPPVYLKHMRELAFCRYVAMRQQQNKNNKSNPNTNTNINITHAGLLHPSRMHRREPHFIQNCQYKGRLNQLFSVVHVPIHTTRTATTTTNNSNDSGKEEEDELNFLFDVDKMEKKLFLDKVCTTLLDFENKESAQDQIEKEKWLTHSSLQLDDISLAGSHCQWNCQYYKKKASDNDNPCFPALSSFPDSIFNMPRLNLNKKTELWNRGVKKVSHQELTGFVDESDAMKKIKDITNGASDKNAKNKQQQQQKKNKDDTTTSDQTKNDTIIPWSSSIASALQAKTPQQQSSTKLSPAQLRFAVSSITKKPVVDRKKIQEFVDQIRYPLIALDFEASQFAVPPHSHYNIYDHLPFQFSAHIIMNDKDLFSSSSSLKMSQVAHREYIHFPTTATSSLLDDPRPHVAQELRKLFEEFTSSNNNNNGVGVGKTQQQKEEDISSEPKSSRGKKKAKKNNDNNKKMEAPSSKTKTKNDTSSSSGFFNGSIVCHNAAFEARVISKLCSLHPTILDPKKYGPVKSLTAGGRGLLFLDTIDLVSHGVTRYEAGGSASMKKQLPLFATEDAIKTAYQHHQTDEKNNNNNQQQQLIVDGMGASNIYWMLANGYKLTSEAQRERLRNDMLRYCAADSYGTIELIRGCAKYL